jgi:hypothetical protein
MSFVAATDHRVGYILKGSPFRAFQNTFRVDIAVTPCNDTPYSLKLALDCLEGLDGVGGSQLSSQQFYVAGRHQRVARRVALWYAIATSDNRQAARVR